MTMRKTINDNMYENFKNTKSKLVRNENNTA